MLRDKVELCEIVTELGAIRVCLFASRAPKTVDAFLTAVDAEIFRGGRFFRAVRPENDRAVPPIEIIQAAAAETADVLIRVPHEPTSDTGLRHVQGTLSLPRGTGLASAHSFFICNNSQPHLDARGARHPDGQGFAAFGQVCDGLEIVDRITNLKTRIDPTASVAMTGQIIRRPPLIVEIRRIAISQEAL